MKVYGLILAGGQGRRMGGADKAMLQLAGRSLLAHVAGRMVGQVAALGLSANGDPARFQGTGLTVLADAPGRVGEGPLAGVLAGLDWALHEAAEALVTVSVDTPFVPRDLVARLAAAATGTDTGMAVAAHRGRLHPTAGLWPITARDALARSFDAGERRLRAALASAAVTEFDGATDPFMNLNTPEDLARAEALLAAAGPRWA